ncbi:MAG: type II toxin-antitoxin system Phd/YefM family antitoxin [bacterium]
MTYLDPSGVIRMLQVPMSEAKARLAEYVRKAEAGELILLTRHDKPVAAIIPAEDVERLEKLRSAGPEGGLARVAGGWEGSDDLVRVVAEHPRTAYRAVPDLEDPQQKDDREGD